MTSKRAKRLPDHGCACQPDRDVSRFAEAVKAAGIKLEFMFPREYELEAVNQALDDPDSGVGLRPLLRIPQRSRYI